jgi:protein SCO1/2
MARDGCTRLVTLERLLLLAMLMPGVATAARPAPEDFAWQPHPGGALPLDLRFTEANGRNVSLRSLTGVPLVLTLGYFHCPTLCGPVRDDVIAALSASGLEGGRDYRLAVFSIDPAETTKDAADARMADLKQTGGDGRGWDYLAGDAAPIAAAVGFPFKWDAEILQYAHPAGVVVLTPTGRISAYLEGVGYSGMALRHAIEQAGTEQVAAEPSPILLLCFHYDAATGKYTLEIYKLLRIMAVMTLVGIAGLLALLHRRRRAQRVM